MALARANVMAAARPVATAVTTRPAPRVAVVRGSQDARIARAREGIAVAKRKVQQIASLFYDVGELLVQLRSMEAHALLGYADFYALCWGELRMKRTKVDALIRIVTRLSRELATRFNQTGAIAILEICDATPELDTPEQIAGGQVTMPSGNVVDLANVSARGALAVAKEIRATANKPPGRGRTVSAAERAQAAAWQAAMVAAGLTRAKVAAVATEPGKPADLRVSGVPMTEAKVAARILGKSAR
jgi:hypothetical protein